MSEKMSNEPIPYIVHENSIVLVVDNISHTISSDNMLFEKIYSYIRKKKWSKIRKSLDPKRELINFSDGKISIRDNVLYWDDRVLNSSLSKRLVSMYKQGFDITPMVMFIKNLMKNPSYVAIEELYEFLENNTLPITDDGCFLAFKRVKHSPSDDPERNIKVGDLVDIYSGKYRNNIGDSPSMKRNEVDDDRTNLCSTGLHFASMHYLEKSGYGSGEHNPIVIIKINPKNVVSIPTDYNFQKGRCWKYTVIGIYNNDDMGDEFFKTIVHES